MWSITADSARWPGQVAELSGGRTCLCPARTAGESCIRIPRAHKGICYRIRLDLAAAHKLVPSHGLPLHDSSVVVPIGAGGKVCEPPAVLSVRSRSWGRPLAVDEGRAAGIPSLPVWGRDPPLNADRGLTGPG